MPRSRRQPAPALSLDGAALNIAITKGFENIRYGVAMLTDQLKSQKDLIAGIAAVLDSLPDGPGRTQLREQMLTVDTQIAEAFALCGAVVDASAAEVR